MHENISCFILRRKFDILAGLPRLSTTPGAPYLYGRAGSSRSMLIAQPFNPVNAIPRTNCFWKSRKRTSVGNETIKDATITTPSSRGGE